MAETGGNQFENGTSITWTTVDNNYIDDKEYLKGFEKWTFVALLRHAFQVGRDARPSQQTLADIVGVSRKTMNEILQRLEAKGFLERKGKHAPTKTIIWRVQVPAEIEIEWKQKDLDRLKKRLGKPVEENYQPDPQPEPTPKPKPKPAEQKDEGIPYKEIIEYLNAVSGRNFSYKVESNKKWIRARMNEENYTIEDFKHVIDVKFAEWIKKENTQVWIRPSTLFGPKFNEYLNQPKQPANSKTPGGKGVYTSTPVEPQDTIQYLNGRAFDLANAEERHEWMKLRNQSKGRAAQ